MRRTLDLLYLGATALAALCLLTIATLVAGGIATFFLSLALLTFDAVTTVTVRIVDALTGDQAFDSPETLAAFALGLVLFVVTLTLNLVSIIVIRKFRQSYE